MTSALEKVGPTSAVDPQVAEAMALQGRLDPLRDALGLQDLTPSEMSLFAMVALHSRLDPFARQIYAIKRKGKVTFQTGIDGFRASAEETGQYRGSDEPIYGPTVDKPYPHPEWATVVVHRQLPNGDRVDQSSTAHWDEFVADAGQDFQWKKMPRVMIAKCAEAAAFRKAFPKRFGQVYVSEEMDQANAVEAATPVGPQTAREHAAARRAELEARSAGSDEAPTNTAPSEEVERGTGAAASSPADGQAPEVVTGAASGAEASEPVAEAKATTQCEAVSPYGGEGRCGKAQGHTGNHANKDKETW